jgi:hypothetical protein
MKKVYMPDSLVRDLSAMVVPKRAGHTLGRPRNRSEIQATRGVAHHGDKGTGGNSGIASPLTEQSRVTQNREIADPFDPSYVITVAEASSVTFKDTNNKTVVLEFELPP